MNKYVVKISPTGIPGLPSGDALELPLWANDATEAEAAFIAMYPGLTTYTYTIELVPTRNQVSIVFPMQAVGFASTSYGTSTTVETAPLVIFESPADYGFPEYTTMQFRFKFRGYNSAASHGFVRLVTDNNGTGTYTAVTNTEVEVTGTTIAQYTSGTLLTLTPGNIYFVQGRCGGIAQTTWVNGAWLIITFS